MPNESFVSFKAVSFVVKSVLSSCCSKAVKMYLLYISPVLSYGAYSYLSSKGYSCCASVCFSVILGYIPTYIETLRIGKYGGEPWPWFQRLGFWKKACGYFDAKIEVEEKLNNEQQYIFCCFPHGPLSVNHMLTMTDGCGMLSKVYTGPRRDLAASVLLLIPIVKELLLWLGCVDAGASTASFNLKKGRSLLIFIGGEKEQLMSENGRHKIYLKTRKGFVKLALQHGAHLLPVYAFGENEVHTIHQWFMKFRLWLQHNLQMGIPLVSGRWGTPLPHKVPLQMEIGKPIVVKKVPKEEITQAMIDELHSTFIKEIQRLFDRTKVKHPGHTEAVLEIF